MKKAIYIIISFLVLLLAMTLPVYAQGATSHGGGGYGHGGSWHGAYWHGAYWRGGYWGGGYWGGPGWGWWGPWWWGYPYYSYSPYYPYYSTPLVIQQQPQEYIQQDQTPQREQQGYWYYCPNPKGYYPYVKKCPQGWLKVIPAPAPEGGEE